jgi:hypothetical protein
MSTDYFAHAVFGVAIDEKDQDVADEKLKAVLASLGQISGLDEDDDDDDNYDPEQIETAIEAVADDLKRELAKKYGKCRHATLFRSSPEDDRPGRCDTEADLWIWGVNIFGVVEAAETGKLPKDWHWYTWVTAY